MDLDKGKDKKSLKSVFKESDVILTQYDNNKRFIIEAALIGGVLEDDDYTQVLLKDISIATGRQYSEFLASIKVKESPEEVMTKKYQALKFNK